MMRPRDVDKRAELRDRDMILACMEELARIGSPVEVWLSTPGTVP